MIRAQRAVSYGPDGRGWVRAALALAAFAACSAAAAESRADAAFEARCAALPPARFSVSEAPVTYALDDGGQTIDQLTLKSGHTPSTHMTFGLTTVHFGYEAEIAINVIEETQSGRACGALTVEARLAMQPATVFLAQELATSPCARAVTLEHEEKHLAVFRQVLSEARRDLDADMAATLGRQVRRAGSRDELERTANARVKDYLSDFIRRWHRIMEVRQEAVDSPSEHARVKNACPASG